MDMQEFLQNRVRVPEAELDKYTGKYVAWSPDGTKILAADIDPMKVIAKVKAAGHDPADCVISSIPEPEEVVLGGGLDE